MTSKKHIIAALGQGLPIRQLVDSVFEKTGQDNFELYFERALVRGIVYREPHLEPTIRDLYNRGSDCIVDFQSKDTIILDYEFETNVQLEMIRSAITVLVRCLEVMHKHCPYDEATQALKHEFSHDLIDYKPSNDGVDHINVYSKGKTKLGRLLSNFSHTAFTHPVYGYFASIEAFWYWYMLGCTDNDIRGLYGFKAKKYGMEKRAEEKGIRDFQPNASFRIAVKEALLCKIEQHDETRELLATSTLPLIHYYCWGDPNENFRITYPQQNLWVIEYLELLRQYLKGKAYKLLLAGEQTKNHIDLIEKELEELGIKAIQYLTIGSRKINAAAYLSAKTEIPYLVIPVDEKNPSKLAALLIANSNAVYNSNAAVILDKYSEQPSMKDLIEKVDQEEEYVCVFIHPKKEDQ